MKLAQFATAAMMSVGLLGASATSVAASVYPPETAPGTLAPARRIDAPIPVTSPIPGVPPGEAPVPDAATDNVLPRTGASTGPVMQVGAGILAVGLTAVVAGRRRRFASR